MYVRVSVIRETISNREIRLRVRCAGGVDLDPLRRPSSEKSKGRLSTTDQLVLDYPASYSNRPLSH